MVHGRHVDLRVSTVPTQYGEKTVIRILDNRSITLGLEQLGPSNTTSVSPTRSKSRKKSA
jgi:type IV pilus assembly protein PilB